jgi:uncharacterized protein YdeI (YjbR/CyaY-like superfamily)
MPTKKSAPQKAVKKPAKKMVAKAAPKSIKQAPNTIRAKVDAYLKRAGQWREAMEQMRAIALECPMDEDFKWGHPCYAFQGGNVVLIHGFKEYCAYLFFKGALMKDPKGLLIQQTKNVQAARQIRFTSAAEVVKQKAALKASILEAIAVEKAGMKVAFKAPAEFPVAAEFRKQLDKHAALKRAFEALTPGRQRAYLLHFSAPKQSVTREARVEKCIPMILDGLGLNDK